MKAVVYEGKGKFELKDMPVRQPEAGEVVLKLAYCGICGSDLHMAKGEWDERIKTFPRVIGHEASGEIVQLGSGVTDWKIGDRVVVRPLKSCGYCPACLSENENVCKDVKYLGIEIDGAFQNYWTVPADILHHCPEEVSLKHAALVEPLAVACHAVQRSGIRKGGTAVVIGGGPIGLMTAIVLKTRGVRVVVSELSQLRLENCRKFGIETLDSTKESIEDFVEQITNGYGVDAVFEASGSQGGFSQAPHLCHPNGKIIMVATYGKPMQLVTTPLHFKQLELVTTRAYQKKDFDEALDLMKKKAFDCDALISRVMPLEQLEEAMQACMAGADVVKILMDCQSIQ